MEIFSALLALCVGNSPVTGELHVPSQRPVTWSFDVFYDLRSNKRLSKQSWGWWFETPSHPSRRHCNDMVKKNTSLTPGDEYVRARTLDNFSTDLLPKPFLQWYTGHASPQPWQTHWKCRFIVIYCYQTLRYKLQWRLMKIRYCF